MNDELTREAVSEAVSASSYGVAAGNILVGLTLNDLSILVGVLLALLTFVINWYYKHQAHKLEQQKLQMQRNTEGKNHGR